MNSSRRSKRIAIKVENAADVRKIKKKIKKLHKKAKFLKPRELHKKEE
jgi:hypothetical protein